MSRRSRQQVRAMEARTSELVAALRDSGDSVALDLACRLWQCQQQRHERRSGIRDRVDRPCRSIACEYCRRRRGREWRERAAAQMRHAEIEHSSMATVMLARTGDMEEVRDVVREFRVALRNLRARRAREDARWRSMSVVGLAEVDILAPEEITFLPPSRRLVVEQLPVRSHSDDDQFTIVVHVHLFVSHPAIPRHAVERVLMSQWLGTGRVDVRALNDDGATAPEHAGGIIAYASKHSMVTKLDGCVESPVPTALQARYWSWLHGLRSGLAPLRVRMSAMRDPADGVLEEQDDEPEVEMMPIAIGIGVGAWSPW